MKKIKIAAWSIGEHAQRNILPALLNTTKLELKGLYSRNKSNLKELSNEYGCKAYSSSLDMLGDLDLDAIYISSPNSLHFDQIMASLKHGKHVIVEKSALATISEANKVLKYAGDNGLIVMEAFMFRFHQQFESLKRLMESEKYGKVNFIEASFGFPHLEKENIRYSSMLSGGALNDAGAYTISAILSLLGHDSVLEYSLLETERGFDVDTSGLAVFKKSGAKAVCKWVFGASYLNEIKIWSEHGHVLVERAFSKPSSFDTKIIVTHNGKLVEEVISGHDNHFVNMFDYFAEIVMKKDFIPENNKLLSQALVMDKIRNNRL
jgi:dTDP-3,4-didehydro-2,6-dideoxy-alpha-D-glucose 3-reductase